MQGKPISIRMLVAHPRHPHTGRVSRIEIRIALVISLCVGGSSPSQAASVASGLSVIEAQVTKGRAAKTGYTRVSLGRHGPMLIAMGVIPETIF
jgi:fructoselysine-6-P-deglycase FrlB-like protein